jgi:hypothetical protein
LNIAFIHQLLSLLTVYWYCQYRKYNGDVSITANNFLYRYAREQRTGTFNGRDALDEYCKFRRREKFKSYLLLLFEHYNDTKQEPQTPLLFLIRPHRAFATLLYSFFWVIPLRLNFMCRRFGTLCSIFIGGVSKFIRCQEAQSPLCGCARVCVRAEGRQFFYLLPRELHTDTAVHKSQATTFYTVAPNVCGSSVWILRHVALPEPKILRWLLDLWKMCAFLYTDIVQRNRWPDYGEGEHYNRTLHTGVMT